MHKPPDTPILLLWLVVAVVFIGIGVWIARTPPEITLGWDRRTGYWIYQRVLQATGDEKRAMAAAGKFYRLFGMAFCSIAGIHVVIVSAILLARALAWMLDS
jgi:hypothetical protein